MTFLGRELSFWESLKGIHKRLHVGKGRKKGGGISEHVLLYKFPYFIKSQLIFDSPELRLIR